MRKINSHNFQIATRKTSREVNRKIILNLIRERQPLSRADLARLMKTTRSAVTSLVNQLINEGEIYEGTTGETARGRKPIFLHTRTNHRLVMAIDVRFSQTYLMLSDLNGNPISIESFKTVFVPGKLIKEIKTRVGRILGAHKSVYKCEGIGLVIPGIIDPITSRIINAPQLGWHNVDLREELSRVTNLPVQIENPARACALSQMWTENHKAGSKLKSDNFVYLSVSDGVGVGIVVNGELVRGAENKAGEFGHIPLNLEGPRCLCGALGCWEAYISNLATLSRYFGRDMTKLDPSELFLKENFTVAEVISRAFAGDAKAIEAINTTAKYLGLGLANVIKALNPGFIYIGGEITAAWEMIEPTVRASLSERALTEETVDITIRIVRNTDYPRLRGAAALLALPAFAAPRVA